MRYEDLVAPVKLQLINGLTTRVLDTGGDKPTLVLIHGLADAIEIWGRFCPGCRPISGYRFSSARFGEA